MDKKIPTDSLTDKQKDYATFLPAMSSFFARDLGKARHEEDYILPKRVPQNFEHGVEGLNYMKPKGHLFLLQVAFISCRTRRFEYETLFR